MMWLGFIWITCYIFVLLWLLFGFFKHASEISEDPKNSAPLHSFSIVVPFRNEAETLSELLHSINKLKYPNYLFEVILVNDASEDTSVANVATFTQDHAPLDIRCIENVRISASPKKDAITHAISISKYEWIVTTDADCHVPETWLTAVNKKIKSSNCQFIAAPVMLENDKGFLHNFQLFDFLSLQLVTAGSFGWKCPLFCNGANLAYTKELFNSVNGFTGNDTIASGDDIFLMDKVRQQFPKQICYLKSKEAIVVTKAVTSWSHLVTQRVRWASKTSKQQNSFSKLIGIVVMFTNLWIVAGIVIFSIISEKTLPFSLLLLAKWGVDSIVILCSAAFFGRKINPFYFVLSLIFYPFFLCYIFLRSLGGHYEWKGRNYSKQV